MTKPRILLQLDSDNHASVFDAVVAVDAEVDHLLQYHSVRPDEVRNLIHGAMFTRGPKDLKNTAVFIGGVDVDRGEELLGEVAGCFFGPMRVSVMLDANGANTTAAAAVIAAARHVELADSEALVLAGTGPVGQRAARLLARRGARVRVASRSQHRAEQICELLHEVVPDADFRAVQTADADQTREALDKVDVLIAAGAAGIELVPESLRAEADDLKVAIDLNAVPPLGIAGVGVTDKATEYNGVICYGAIGVGGTKMKIHAETIRRLFQQNDLVFNAEEIFELGLGLE